MTTDQLTAFFETAKCLNFSQAARNLYVSQSNLTKSIANLEKELGFRLFDRSTHHCRLTEEGEQFLRTAESSFYQLSSTIELAKIRARNHYRIVRIGIAQDELPPRDFLRQLNRENASEHLRYMIRKGNYRDLLSDLREQRLDLIVTTDKNARLADDMEYLTLRPFHMLLAVHNSNPKAGQKDLKPEDFPNELLLMCIPEGKNAPLQRVEEIQMKTGMRLNLDIVYSPADVLWNVQIGAGVGIIPSTVDFTQYRDISYHRFEEDEAQQVLAWRKNETNAQVLELIAHIRELAPFPEETEWDKPNKK